MPEKSLRGLCRQFIIGAKNIPHFLVEIPIVEMPILTSTEHAGKYNYLRGTQKDGHDITECNVIGRSKVCYSGRQIVVTQFKPASVYMKLTHICSA